MTGELAPSSASTGKAEHHARIAKHTAAASGVRHLAEQAFQLAG